MYRYKSLILIVVMTLIGLSNKVVAQNTDGKKEEKPVILYSSNPTKYEIADIQLEIKGGISNYSEDVVRNASGLVVGQIISVPGDEITKAIKRYWRRNLYSNVQITAEKIQDGKVWLKISLVQSPRVKDINFYGIKKSERNDLEMQIGLLKGSQITPNVVNRAKKLIQKYFDGKGFKNNEVIIRQREVKGEDDQIIVDIEVDKKEKVKVNEIVIEGNQALKTSKIKRVMKKTNEKGKLKNIFRTKKFVPENYEADKELIISKYNELGYRDARIVEDSVFNHDDNTVNVYIKIDEGQKYYIRNIKWIGNTLYSVDQLNYFLKMKSGDVYNQKKLEERLTQDEDAVANLYQDNGYLFYRLEPVETNVVGDSIDLELRMMENQQATLNKITIMGNDRLYEEVIRRELRIKPGQLYSKSDLIRSLREIQQTGHFDPEKMQPEFNPDPKNGLVDITFPLVSKRNDQVQFSFGWGQTGVIGSLSLKFTNFSMANLLKAGKARRFLLPQGDGQTLSIGAQTNARFYQSYNLSFFDPWFGGKRPNSLSVNAFFSRQTAISNRYYGSGYFNNLYNNYYGGIGGYNYNNYENFYDPDQYMYIWGLSVGLGKRLKWPDDYFILSTSLSYNRYVMNNWIYFPVRNGSSNDLNISIDLSRNSIDHIIFPRVGSEFSLSAQITPPYSLFDGKDYKSYYREDGSISQDNQNKLHNWIEYHKWKLRFKTYTPLTSYSPNNPKALVLMTRTEFGMVGHYNKYKKSPFGTFNVGGDGMTGYSNYATESIALRGYENGSLTPFGQEAYAYARLGMELRYPLMLDTSTNIYVLGFLEAGNAWREINKINPFELKRSAGFGVRIFLPMLGMMGIDWGYGFDKLYGSASRSGSQFHFILGQEF